MLLAARNKETDNKLYLRWAIGYQSEMSFSEFKERISPAVIKSTKTILKDVYGIIGVFNNCGISELSYGDI